MDNTTDPRRYIVHGKDGSHTFGTLHEACEYINAHPGARMGTWNGESDGKR